MQTTAERVSMKVEGLQSFKLELLAKRDALLPRAMGHQGLALFLNLIKQFDPALSARLHDEPGYRPYTLSLLHGVDPRGESVLLHAGQSYGLRVTLLDGGSIWQRFQTHFLETHRRDVRLGEADLQLTRVVVTPATDSTGWVNTIEWSDLAALPSQETVTLSFITPTAFSLGERAFRLFPEPTWVWESALRDWNRYAPRRFQLEKSVVREGVERYIGITKGGAIAIETLHFSGYIQKGFVGTCTYTLQDCKAAPYLARLAAFVFYAGVGYKTTMGMGQVRVRFSDALQQEGTFPYQTGGALHAH